MTVDMPFKRVVYEESIRLEPGSLASLVGRFGFAKAETVRVECGWARKGNLMATERQLVVVGDQQSKPSDRTDKAVRTVGASRPVYLDEGLLVMRSNPEYIIWVFEKSKGKKSSIDIYR